MEKRFKKGDKVFFANLASLCGFMDQADVGEQVEVQVEEREVRASGKQVMVFGAAKVTHPLLFSTSSVATSSFGPEFPSATAPEALHKLDDSLKESERRLLVMLERVRQGRAQVAEKLVGAGERVENAPRISEAVVDRLRRHAEKPLREGGESPGFSIMACRNILKALGIPFDTREQ